MRHFGQLGHPPSVERKTFRVGAPAECSAGRAVSLACATYPRAELGPSTIHVFLFHPYLFTLYTTASHSFLRRSLLTSRLLPCNERDLLCSSTSLWPVSLKPPAAELRRASPAPDGSFDQSCNCLRLVLEPASSGATTGCNDAGISTTASCKPAASGHGTSNLRCCYRLVGCWN